MPKLQPVQLDISPMGPNDRYSAEWIYLRSAAARQFEKAGVPFDEGQFRLYRQVHEPVFSSMYRSMLGDGSHVFVGYRQRVPVGFIWIERYSDHVDISGLYVAPEYWGQGIGGKLARHAGRFVRDELGLTDFAFITDNDRVMTMARVRQPEEINGWHVYSIDPR